MKKTFLAIILACPLIASAQIKDDKNTFNHLSAGIDLGTTGIGFTVGTTVCPWITLRAGADFMPRITVGTNLKIQEPDDWSSIAPIIKNHYLPGSAESGYFPKQIDLDAKTNIWNAKLLLDLYTGKNSMFHFTVGMYMGSSNAVNLKAVDRALQGLEMYNNDVENGIQGVGKEKILVNGYELGIKDGRASLSAQTWAVKPYIGIGVGRAVPRKRVGVKGELGVMFWGAPELHDDIRDKVITHNMTEESIYYPGGDGVSVKGTTTVNGTINDAADITHRIIGYPVLKLTVFGRIF